MAAAGARGIQSLVLDAAPLLTQARIAGLADKYYIPPSVLAELRDVRAREYLENLHATGQVDLHVREPSAAALAKGTWEWLMQSLPLRSRRATMRCFRLPTCMC